MQSHNPKIAPTGSLHEMAEHDVISGIVNRIFSEQSAEANFQRMEFHEDLSGAPADSSQECVLFPWMKSVLAQNIESSSDQSLPNNRNVSLNKLDEHILVRDTVIEHPYSHPSELNRHFPYGHVDPAGAISATDFYFLRGNPESADNFGKPSMKESTHNSNDLSEYRMFHPESIRNDFPVLHQTVHGQPLVWLDNAATTQKPNAVIQTIKRFYEQDNSNIHRGAHTLAARATDAYEDAREKVRRFIGAGSKDEIIFVRGTTEGVNLLANTIGKQQIEAGDVILISELEHHANIVPWQMLAKEKGARIKPIPINSSGEIMMEEYEQLFCRRTRLVCITQVSNALGTVVPVDEMIEVAHRKGALVVVDGAQSVQHMTTNVQKMDADFFVFSGHKVYGPTGIGVVYGKMKYLQEMPPWQGGGNMIDRVTFEETTYNGVPMKFEAGTPNVADVIGLGAAIDYVSKIGMENISRYEHELMNYMVDSLYKVPGLKLIGNPRNRSGAVSLILPPYTTQAVAQALDRKGIALRAGHHCAQPALRHFGLESSVRPSLAIYNTMDDIDRLVHGLNALTR